MRIDKRTWWQNCHVNNSVIEKRKLLWGQGLKIKKYLETKKSLGGMYTRSNVKQKGNDLET